MKYLITIIAAVVLVGCGETQQSTAKAPVFSIYEAARRGDIEAVKQRLMTQKKARASILDLAIELKADPEIIDLLRKHGAKTGEELKAEGK